MPVRAIDHFWTPAEVRALTAAAPGHWPRYELLHGELFVTPAPAPIHQVATTEFLLELAPYVERESLGVVLTPPADLELQADQITQPDLFVTPLGELAAPEHKVTWADVRSLLLVIEVISPSSIHTDRVDKRDHYMSAGVPEYWVADIDARVVEQWNPDRATPRIATRTLTWHPGGAESPLVIDLRMLFERALANSRRLGTR